MPAESEATPIADMSKKVEEFRNYTDSDRQETVENHYRLMRVNQTVEFADRMLKKIFF